MPGFVKDECFRVFPRLGGSSPVEKGEIREEILREAKESYEKEKKREEMKRARGEDTWMLPTVKKRLGFKGEVSAPERKKKKKREKEGQKKHKRHKSSKAEREGSDSGGSGEEGEEEEEDEWVEKGSGDHEVPSSSTTEDQSSE